MQKNGSNTNWKTTCDPPADWTYWQATTSILGLTNPRINSKKLFRGLTDAAVGSVWPAQIQDRLADLLVEDGSIWDNIEYDSEIYIPTNNRFNQAIEGLVGN